jgi:DsbC/DsbD-like thiol-disulfide interchange protein
MRALFLLMLNLWVAVAMPSGAQAQSAAFGGGPTHITATLVAETQRPAAGSTVTLAFVMKPAPGWHGYWDNPGDAGQGMALRWTLPQGASMGTPRYPVPQTLLLSGLMNHVFEGPYAVLVDMKVPDGLKVGTRLPVRVFAQWLACTDAMCVPESGNLAVDLLVSGANVPPENRAQFDGYRGLLPRPLGGQAHFSTDGKLLRLGIAFPASARIEKAWFFRLTPGAASYAAPQSISRNGDMLVIETPSAETLSALDGARRRVRCLPSERRWSKGPTRQLGWHRRVGRRSSSRSAARCWAD